MHKIITAIVNTKFTFSNKTRLCDSLVWNVDPKGVHLHLEIFLVVAQPSLEVMYGTPEYKSPDADETQTHTALW